MELSTSPLPPAAPFQRRPVGRPRIYADPLPGQEPTPEQLQRQRDRGYSHQAYHKDPDKAKRQTLQKYAALKAARAAQTARLAELEAQALATAKAAAELMRLVSPP